MYQGVADEAVVAVKLSAGEGMVTFPRIKLKASDKDVGGEGRNKKSVDLTIHTHLSGGSAMGTEIA